MSRGLIAGCNFVAGLAVLVTALGPATGCSRNSPQAEKKQSFHWAVHVDCDDGTVIERTVDIATKDGISEASRRLQKDIGKPSGRIIFRFDSPELEEGYLIKMVGHLNHGRLEGWLRNYGMVENKEMLMGEIPYHNDMRQGTGTSYYPFTGRISMQCGFRDNVRDGEMKVFYADGQLAEKGRYVHGGPEGEWTFFDPQGAVVASGIYEQGSRKSGTFVENREKFVQAVHNGFTMEVQVSDVSGKIVRSVGIRPPRVSPPKSDEPEAANPAHTRT